MSTSQFNLSIFKEENDDNNNDKCKMVENCISIKKLLTALKYYSTLNVINNEDKNSFNHFIQDIYPNLLNDYNHLILSHSADIQEINEKVIQCNITNCNFTLRHHSGRNNGNTDCNENFYVEIMNGLHFYVYHLFDTAIRVKRAEQKYDDNGDGDDVDPHFDAEFDRINKIIAEKREITATFDRFQSNNTKYMIHIDHQASDNNNTFLDEIYTVLLEVDVHDKDIPKFGEFINEEHYESDSIVDDIENYGNITKYIQNKKCIDSIKNMIENAKISCFSIGYRFYYWRYYESIQQLPNNEVVSWNIHNHNGHKICDLFITPRYTNFKEETINNKYMTMKKYQEKVVIKAKKYENTDTVKQWMPVINEWKDGRLYYDDNITNETPLSYKNLLALILYTDFTALSSDFSSTFRKIKMFESLKNIKTRNSAYFWMSKILRETVELYGRCRHEKDKNGGLCGSFYCGLSWEMKISSFNMRLNCPTSTSVHIEIATKFCGDDGIIIQFNNNSFADNDILRGFPCDWISKYPDEAERLFFGGHWRIKVESVRIKRTLQNFKNFIHSMWHFDNMITGGDFYRITSITVKTLDVDCLICSILGKEKEKEIMSQIDPYIQQTFKSFIIHKKQITIYLNQLYYADKKMRDLIMNPLDFREHKKQKEIKRDAGDFRNLFLSKMLAVFKNLKSIVIKTTTWGGKWSYSLSLSALLKLISSSSSSSLLRTITIKAVSYSGYNWIDAVWSISSSQIKKEYKKNGYNIELKQFISSHGYQEYDLIIYK